MKADEFEAAIIDFGFKDKRNLSSELNSSVFKKWQVALSNNRFGK